MIAYKVGCMDLQGNVYASFGDTKFIKGEVMTDVRGHIFVLHPEYLRDLLDKVNSKFNGVKIVDTFSLLMKADLIEFFEHGQQILSTKYRILEFYPSSDLITHPIFYLLQKYLSHETVQSSKL